MKKHLINNLVLSASVWILLLALSSSLEYNFSPYYYLTIAFFFLTYTTQYLLLFKLGTTSSRFILIYNLTTMLKMLMSLLFLCAYYLLFTQSINTEKNIHFSIFFIITYFTYLIVNTKSFFSEKHEKSI